jgi:hypothetical protein
MDGLFSVLFGLTHPVDPSAFTGGRSSRNYYTGWDARPSTGEFAAPFKKIDVMPHPERVARH